MAGARLIMNSRYFHIAKPGEQLSEHVLSGAHVSALVEYCGTRETVSLNIKEENKNLPATEKQVETIDELIELVKGDKKESAHFDYKDTFEYKDYVEAPTMQNASELISRLSEMALMNDDNYRFDTVSNLVEYAAKRPGAVRVGSHGLFSSFNNVDLDAAKEEISTHEGNIWSDIFSIRREDADALGYDSQAPWRSLVMSNMDKIAEAHQIKPENLRWYAAMHNTGHHPHIHLFVYSTDPKEGFLSKSGIETLKSEFATDIFKNELLSIYQKKDKYLQHINTKTKKILNEQQFFL